ncbi:hypothetical protein ACFVAJ_18380 [Agromyces sp. NPDC057679]|uniref:hypothetical protein n=1 Tax=Agromyces sp. NPDC057679 TaxID=3346207 RepID=UPI00366CDDDA
MTRRQILDRILTEQYANERVSRSMLDPLIAKIDEQWDDFAAAEAAGGRTVEDQLARIIWARLVKMDKATSAAAAICAAMEESPEVLITAEAFEAFCTTVGEDFWTVDVLKASDDEFISGALVSANHRKRIFDAVAAHIAGKPATSTPMTLAVATA